MAKPQPITERSAPTSFYVKPSTKRLIAARAKVWRRSQSSYLEELVLAEAGKSSTIPLAPATYTPTATEKRAIAKGREEIRRGEYVTLEQLEAYVERLNRRPSSKGPRPRAKKRA
jgi:hypothetical protein